MNDFIKRLKQTGSIIRKSGSGRLRTAQTTANIDAVDELVLSQEDAPLTHSTVRHIAREMHIHPPGSTPVVNNVDVGGRSCCSWPALPDFLVIDPVCFKRLIKSFNVLFFNLLA